MTTSKKGRPNEKLRTARKKQGWSQEELARKVDTTPVSITRWETGVTFPSPYFRRKLSEVFGRMSLEELGLVEDTSVPQETVTDLVPPALPDSPVSFGLGDTMQEAAESKVVFEEQKERVAEPVGVPNRQRMLKRVRSIWIKGLLEDSLYGAALITLGLHKQPEALANPWRFTVQELDHASRPLPPDTRITQVYDNADGELLILGEPGVGKTTLLLELARDLLDRAERDITHPMPVVFNLSSWAQKRQQLTTWLVEEMHSKYHVSKSIGQAWIDNDQVLPLLDGLDEVAPACREGCLKALNMYRQVHQHMPIVVCSRSAEYLIQATRLALNYAVVVQPLTRQQIDDYLLSAGERLEAVRVALTTDLGLLEMVQTPLMLSILTLAYSDESIQGLLAEHSPQARRRQVFAMYVERMLKRRGHVARYTRRQTVHRLSFLARQLVKHNQTVFYVERLQPAWLTWPHFRISYHIFVPLIIGLIYGLAFELIGGPIFGLVSVLIVGLVFGLIRSIEPAEVISWSWTRLRQNRGYGLVYGLVSGLVYALVSGLVHGPIGGPMSAQLYSGDNQISKLLGGLGGGLIAGLMFEQARRKIRIPIVISWQWGNRHQNLIYGLMYGLVSGLINGLISGLVFEESPALTHGLVGGLAFGLAGGLIVVMLGGLSYDSLDEHEHTTPNEGIWRSVRRGIYSALVFGLVGLIISATHGLSGALILGLVFAMSGGLFFGGATCIQHFMLRGFLWLSGSIPPDYVRFLDYTVERIFLRRVGGGYIFIHRLLLDYFASLDSLEPV